MRRASVYAVPAVASPVGVTDGDVGFARELHVYDRQSVIMAHVGVVACALQPGRSTSSRHRPADRPAGSSTLYRYQKQPLSSAPIFTFATVVRSAHPTTSRSSATSLGGGAE